MGTAKSRLSVFHKSFKEEKDFWFKKLAHDAEVTELATDFARSAIGEVETESFGFTVSDDVCARLSKLAGDSPFLIYAALMAGLQVCLHKHTGARKIRVGSPARTKDDESPINALAIVSEVDSTTAFRSLLMMVRETLIEAYSKQNYPYKSLLRDLDLDSITNRCPLFGITLALKTVHGELPPLNVDVAISFEKNAEKVSGRLEYNSTLFHRETLERFVGHYLNVLKIVTANVNVLIRDVEILTEAEQQQLLVEWNDTTAPRPKESCLHKMFEAQVERTPEAVAVETASERLSYLELNERANRLAAYLRKCGVKLEDRVGVCLERSTEMIVALLGVLKAGAAYLPLDPTYPRERLDFMIQDAGVKVLLSAENLNTDYKDLESGSVVSPSNAAYVIYTSGSTGQPKGVLVQHGGACNMVAAQIREFDVQPQSRVLQFASLGFDASVSEIFTTLAVGATLYLADRELLAGTVSLTELLNTNKITIVTLPPAVLNLLDEKDFPSLKTLVAAGEACSAEVATRWSKGRRFINAYGPTEASVCTTLHHHNETDISTPPIGRPISNLRVYILNTDLQPVPVGVAGELFIAGDGLARGYLSRPELTAEKFVPDPFSREGERLYRSGDSCRWLTSGEIEFLGRIDNQVKLRGFRIELGEIEAVLRTHPAVRESVVVVNETGSSGKRLVAYVVVEGGEVTGNALRDYLKERLPEYMMPPVFMLLDELPLNTNGKVDRRRLPEPDVLRSELREGYVAPATELEELVAGIWGEVLGLQRVGRNDDFFDLGGHSLIATQVMVRVRRTTGIDLPLRVLFESPTVAALASQIEAALCTGVNSYLPPLLPVSRDEELPLSFAQQRLWFLDQLEPGSSVYNCPVVLRFRGALNIAALEQSFTEVVRRHEVLRTSFRSVGGHPLQVIAPSLHMPLSVFDLSDLPADRVEAELQRLSLLEGQRAFDLSQGPLLRMKLLRVSAAEHVVLLTIHHIISDGWSIGVLVKEAAALYEAYASGTMATLESLPVQYADYAYWEREWLQGEVLAGQMDYWKQQLDGAPVLELPTDHPRPYVQTYSGSYTDFQLSKELSSGLNDLSRRLDATLFMTLLASWQTLLYRYSGQTDIVVGSPIANRQRTETEALIGFFVNTLALRTDLSGNPSFSEVVQRVRETALGAYAHQALPFEKVIEELQLERDASHTPLVQVAFVLQNAPQGDLTALDLTLNYMEVVTDTAKFDLTLMLQESADGLSGRLEYRDDLFEPGTIKRLLAHFENLLRGILEEPDQHVAQLPLLSEPEKQQVTELWNDTATVYERDSSIHELFEAQVELTPEALAVASNGARLSYRELDQRSNQLARQLQSVGVASDELVGISLARSEQLVIALLGILKAGGAYVFLDASYPEERLALMLRDAGVKVLITEKRLKEKFEPVVTLVCMDEDEAEIATRSREKLGTPFHSADQLAYVSYTSGSTGTPKGVAVTHRGVVRLVRTPNYATFGEETVFLQHSAASFDALTLEVWVPLLNGGCCAVPSEQILTATELGEAINHYGVNLIWITSSMFNAIVDKDVHALSGLRQLLVGGEVLSTPHIRRTVEQLPQTQLINGYGPTENTTFTCCFPIKQDFDFANSIPIGPPIANSRVYILDEEMQPVPIGVPGELYIAGDGLARGYVSRPELTAEKFVPDPFSKSGERLYRSGDLARWLPTGEIEFIGRRDGQVKVRGFRIELGEVEATLKRIPDVREAVVGLTRDGSNLVAYVVAGDSINEEQIRASLRAQLPAYMVPGQLMLLEQLPLTRHGKVDEQALRLLAESRDRGEEGGAPVSEVEQTVADVWGSVLGLEKLGREANFFELGGHSLLATQAIARIRERLQLEIPLLKLFESPTVAEFAGQIETVKQIAQPAVNPIKPTAREGELPLSFAQQRFWYLDRLHPGNPAAYNFCVLLRVTGPLNVPALEQAINEIIHRHEALRTIFPEVEGWPAQVILPEQPIDLLVADLSALSNTKTEAAQRRLASAEAERPFDLSSGSLIRASVLRMDESEHIVQVTMHHIISDGWSLGILCRELSALYEAFAAGSPTPLPALSIQYGDFAVWQRQHLQGDRLEEQLSYWKKQLAGIPPVLELPSDRPRPEIATFRGTTFQFMLPEELSESIKWLSRREGVTLFMTLLAAFDVLLYRYTYQTDIVVGTAIANRNRRETEPLIGFFVNMLVMRTDMNGNPSFRELLERVKQMTLAAYQHQDVPFEQIMEMLQPQRSLNRSPVYQVEFTLQNAPVEPLETQGLTFTPISVAPDSTDTDFNFLVSEVENRLAGTVVYSMDLFDEATIERMTNHFQTLLQGIVEEPERRILELDLTTNREAQALLAQWDGGAKPRLTSGGEAETNITQSPMGNERTVVVIHTNPTQEHF